MDTSSRRLTLVVSCLCHALVLGACTDEPDGPPDAGGGSPGGAVARIELTPGSLLMVEPGAQHRLTARPLDVSGNAVDAQMTWSSSAPETVSVAADGTITAKAAVGSALITAEADGVRSPPAMVVVARVEPGTVLVSDAQIASDPVPVGADQSQFEVRLRQVPAPAPGVLLLSRESRALAGRVVASVPEADGVKVTCDTVGLDEAFVELSIDEQLPLAAPGTPGSSKDPLEFEYGPFECETSASPKLSFALPITLKLEPDVDTDFKIEVKDGELKHFRTVVTGTMAVAASGALETTAAFSAEFKCETEFHRFPIPVGGAVSFIVAPVVPLGAGFVADGSFELAQLKLGWEGRLGATVTAGFDYTPEAGLDGIATFEPIRQLDPVFELPMSPSEDLRLKIGFQPYSYVRLGLGFFPYLGGPSLDVFEATSGPRAEFDYATEAVQVEDTNYASSYGIKLKARLGFDADVTEALQFLGGVISVAPPELNVEVPLASSPSGTFSVSPSTVETNEPVELTVTIDPDTATFLGIDNIDQVALYRVEKASGALTPVTELKSTAGQVAFQYSWVPTEADEGDHRFVAFVRPNVLGYEFLPMLEVANDTSMNVFVHGKQVPPPEFAGRLTVLSNFNDCDDDTSAETKILFPNGVVESDVNYGICTAGDGITQYHSGNALWTGAGGHLEISTCCPEPDNGICDPVITSLDWNPDAGRWEGMSDSDPPSPNGPLQVCAYSEPLDFTGVCAAPGCVTIQIACNGQPQGGPTVMNGCATLGWCESGCSECASGRPYPWEASVTPVCF